MLLSVDYRNSQKNSLLSRYNHHENSLSKSYHQTGKATEKKSKKRQVCSNQMI